MWLLDDELRAAQIALADFLVARLGVQRSAGREAWARMAYSTKGFITAVRRFAKLFKSMKENGRDFPPHTRKALSATWRRKEAFFAGYLAARDAIEHIYGHVDTSNEFFSYFESSGTVTAAVTPTGRADVGDLALENLLECRGYLLSGMQLDYLMGMEEARALGSARASLLWTMLDRATLSPVADWAIR